MIDPVGPVGTDDNTVEEWSPNGVVWRRRQYKKRCMPLNTTETKPPPPQPRFPRSLYIRANLTVPRADYTEPYEVRSQLHAVYNQSAINVLLANVTTNQRLWSSIHSNEQSKSH